MRKIYLILVVILAVIKLMGQSNNVFEGRNKYSTDVTSESSMELDSISQAEDSSFSAGSELILDASCDSETIAETETTTGTEKEFHTVVTEPQTEEPETTPQTEVTETTTETTAEPIPKPIKTQYDTPFDIEYIKSELIALGESMGMTHRTAYKDGTVITPDNSSWELPITANSSFCGEMLKRSLRDYVLSYAEYHLYGSEPITHFTIYVLPLSDGYEIYFLH